MSAFLRYLFPHLFIILTEFSQYSAASSWPVGRYGLPMPVSGCPRSNFTWKTGWRFQDTEDKNPQNSRSPILHVEGLVRESSVNRSFCMKTSGAENVHGKRWPQGEYCIYKGSNTCPRGLRGGQVEWDDEDNDNQNKKGGTLPQGSYQDSVSASTTIGFCCSTSGSKTSPIDLPVDSPFYLLAYNSKECQQVRWAVASLEWIHYDTENDNNYDNKFGHYPYGAMGGADGHTIHYCYYTSCQYVFNDTTGVIQSPLFPLKYPNGQLCSWTISAPPNQTIQLRFTHFSLVMKTQGDGLHIYDGKDKSGPIIGNYHGNRLPGDVTSSSNNLFVIFQSDGAWNDKGFRADYRVLDNQDPFITTTTAMTVSDPSSTTSRAVSSSDPSSTTTRAVSSSDPPAATTTTVTSSPFISSSTTQSSNKTSMLRKACMQKSITEVPVASIVVPVILCLAAVIVVTIIVYWRWREMHSAKEKKNPSMRYRAGAINNPAYSGAIILNDTPNSDTDKTTIMLKDEEKEDIYQEVQEQQMDNPLYESTDREPIVSGNILYDSVSSKSKEEFRDELP